MRAFPPVHFPRALEATDHYDLARVVTCVSDQAVQKLPWTDRLCSQEAE